MQTFIEFIKLTEAFKPNIDSIIHTPKFKNWFKNSKMVDDNNKDGERFMEIVAFYPSQIKSIYSKEFSS